MAVMISRIGIKKALNYDKNHESLSIFIVTLNGFPNIKLYLLIQRKSIGEHPDAFVL
jgi:hypothetical protein